MQDMLSMVRKATKGGPMSRRAKRETRDFYLMIAPWLLGFIFLSLAPLLLGLAASFTNYNGLNLTRGLKFIGLANYKRAFVNNQGEPNMDFWISLANTFRYTLIAVPVGQVFAMIVAAIMNQHFKGRAFYRLMLYVPAILPLAGAMRAWGLIFNKNSGLVNALMSMVWPGTAVNWINDYYYLVLYLYVWWHVGSAMIIYLAGLQGIPEELKEAALIDGANKVQVFIHVILPLLTPVIFFQTILGLIGALQVLDVPILLYGRAGLSGNIQMPRNMYMYMIYVYSQVFDFQRYGYGVALSWIFFVIVLILTLVLLLTSKYWVYYEVPQEGETA